MKMSIDIIIRTITPIRSLPVLSSLLQPFTLLYRKENNTAIIPSNFLHHNYFNTQMNSEGNFVVSIFRQTPYSISVAAPLSLFLHGKI